MPALVEQQTRLSVKNILFTTDFSALADNALPYAAAIARHYGAQVHVGHAIPAEPFLAVPVEALPVEFDSSRDEAQHAMERFLKTAPLKDLRVQPILRKGPHEFVFAEMVRRLDIDLVVTATHGRGGLKKLVLGSVAEEIFRTVSCPVMTVGPDVTTRDILRGEVFEVLCAIDSSGSPHALAYAAALAADYGARLTVVHIEAYGELPVYYRQESLEAIRAELQYVVVSTCKLPATPELILRFGNVADNILEFATELDASAIVMGAQHATMPRMAAHLPPSFAYNIVGHAPCPVITVPKASRSNSNI